MKYMSTLTLRLAMHQIDTRAPRYFHNPTIDSIINKFERDQLQIEHDSATTYPG